MKLNEQRIRLSSPHTEAVCRFDPVVALPPSPQRHLQVLTTMLESCSTRGVRPMKYMMVRGSRSWGTQQGEAEASGFSLLYRGRIWAGNRRKDTWMTRSCRNAPVRALKFFHMREFCYSYVAKQLLHKSLKFWEVRLFRRLISLTSVQTLWRNLSACH